MDLLPHWRTDRPTDWLDEEVLGHVCSRSLRQSAWLLWVTSERGGGRGIYVAWKETGIAGHWVFYTDLFSMLFFLSSSVCIYRESEHTHYFSWGKCEICLRQGPHRADWLTGCRKIDVKVKLFMFQLAPGQEVRVFFSSFSSSSFLSPPSLRNLLMPQFLLAPWWKSSKHSKERRCWEFAIVERLSTRHLANLQQSFRGLHFLYCKYLQRCKIRELFFSFLQKRADPLLIKRGKNASLFSGSHVTWRAVILLPFFLITKKIT